MSRPAKIAIGYFAVVCAVIAVVAVIHAGHSGPDASLAPVWAIAAALPGSLLVTALPELGAAGEFLLLVAVAAVQAGLLFAVLRAVRRR
ncbi:SCO4225 family membrane protein [Actinokineospora sp. NPDC004072]